MHKSEILKNVAVVTLGVLGAVTMSTAADSTTQPSTQPFADQYKTASYGIGFDFGRNIRDAKVPLDPELIVAGFKEAMAGQASKLTQQQFAEAMTKVQEELRTTAQAQMANETAQASKEGDDFRAKNAQNPNVKTTASGLQIETLKEGTGASPKATDTVKVHYTGKLISGRVFDSSVERGEPISFPLNAVIPGWTEGLQLMKIGGKSRLTIPSNLAYGTQGSPPTIPPNSTLVFDVELLDIAVK